MAQIVIDGVLFSPVLVHALEPGDLFTPDIAPDDAPWPAQPWRVRFIERTSRDMWWICVGTRGVNGSEFGFDLRPNESVLRAVGARAGRGGAR